jgi:general secretion pathway protein I
MKHCCSQKGFTLIEVMIALAVVAIGLMATLKAINEEVNGANMTRNKMLALWVLENKVSEIRLSANLPSIGTNQGQQILYSQTWQWQTNTTLTANPKIRKVEIAIFSSQTKKSPEALLTQNIYLADLK